MITIHEGNIYSLNKTQELVAREVLAKLNGKRLKRLYSEFFRKVESQIKLRILDSFPVVHSITYPNQRSFIDITFLSKPRRNWPTPVSKGAVYHLRRLQSRAGKLINQGKIITKDKNNKYNLAELATFQNRIDKALVKDLPEIISTINKSKNPKEKAENILLLQFVKPTKRTLDTLYESLSSEYEIIQNNAAYVLSGYLPKYRPTNKQLGQIISLLCSQFSAPINKGLYLLLILMDHNPNSKLKKIICKEASKFLTNKQPNIYLIAKMINDKCNHTPQTNLDI